MPDARHTISRRKAYLLLPLLVLMGLALQAPGARATLSYQFNDIDFSPLNATFFGSPLVGNVRIDGFIEVADTAADDGILQGSEVASFFVIAYDRFGSQAFTGSIGLPGSYSFNNLRIDNEHIFLADPAQAGNGSLALGFETGPAFNDLNGISWGWNGIGQRYSVYSPRDTAVLDILMTDASYNLAFGSFSQSGLYGGIFLDPWVIATNPNPITNPEPDPEPDPVTEPTVADVPEPGTLALLLPPALLLACRTRRRRT